MQIIGHRGLPAAHTENTLTSFEAALNEGADGIELDVRLSKEGIPVIFHDASLERLCHRAERISDLDATALQKISLENKETIPLLEQIINLMVKFDSTTWFIELKEVESTATVATLLRKEPSLHDRLVIISFYREALAIVKDTCPDLRIGCNLAEAHRAEKDEMHTGLDIAALTDELAPYSINPCVNALTPELAQTIRQTGAKLYTWTVNTPEQLHIAINTNADGIMSDDVRWARHTLTQMEK